MKNEIFRTKLNYQITTESIFFYLKIPELLTANWEFIYALFYVFEEITKQKRTLSFKRPSKKLNGCQNLSGQIPHRLVCLKFFSWAKFKFRLRILQCNNHVFFETRLETYSNKKNRTKVSKLFGFKATNRTIRINFS